MSYLIPNYRIADRTTFNKKILLEIYKQAGKKIIDILKQSSEMGLITDCWTYQSMDRYMRIIMCYLDEDFNREYVAIASKELPISHTSIKIAEFIKNNLVNFGIYDKCKTAVTDNAHSMELISEYLNLNWLGCLNHRIQLIINETILKNQEFLLHFKKFKDLVSHFKRSSNDYQNFGRYK